MTTIAASMTTAALATMAVTLSTAANAAEPNAQPAITNAIYFDIPPQALETALIACAETAGVQILFRAELIKGRQSPGIKGLYNPAAAIAALLNTSGLRFEFSGARTVIVSAPANAEANSQAPSLPRSHSQN